MGDKKIRDWPGGRIIPYLLFLISLDKSPQILYYM